MILNAIRVHLAEFGMITTQVPRKILELVRRRWTPDVGLSLRDLAGSVFLSLATQAKAPAGEIREIERRQMKRNRQNRALQRLETISGGH